MKFSSKQTCPYFRFCFSSSQSNVALFSRAGTKRLRNSSSNASRPSCHSPINTSLSTMSHFHYVCQCSKLNSVEIRHKLIYIVVCFLSLIQNRFLFLIIIHRQDRRDPSTYNHLHRTIDLSPIQLVSSMHKTLSQSSQRGKGYGSTHALLASKPREHCI